jgi:hypothetical protein
MRYPVAQPIPESIRVTGDLILAKDSVQAAEYECGQPAVNAQRCHPAGRLTATHYPCSM